LDFFADPFACPLIAPLGLGIALAFFNVESSLSKVVKAFAIVRTLLTSKTIPKYQPFALDFPDLDLLPGNTIQMKFMKK
jgi:hypothetical protein